MTACNGRAKEGKPLIFIIIITALIGSTLHYNGPTVPPARHVRDRCWRAGRAKRKATTIHCYPTEPLAALTEMRSRLGAGAAARCSEWLLLGARNGFGVGAT